jgi:hypothetical protein
MGCGPSRALETVDDSVHVMIQHDKKAALKKGIVQTGYVPRAQHPMLVAPTESKPQAASTERTSANETEGASD